MLFTDRGLWNFKLFCTWSPHCCPILHRTMKTHTSSFILGIFLEQWRGTSPLLARLGTIMTNTTAPFKVSHLPKLFTCNLIIPDQSQRRGFCLFSWLNSFRKKEEFNHHTDCSPRTVSSEQISNPESTDTLCWQVSNPQKSHRRQVVRLSQVPDLWQAILHFHLYFRRLYCRIESH